MPIKTAIVPVAGLGTRLLPISAAVPKELLPLGSKPTLHWIAEELGDAGIERMILVSSKAKTRIAEYFQPNLTLQERLNSKGETDILNSLWSHSRHSNMQIDVAIQHEQRGLGDAVLCGKPEQDQPVMIALGDCVIGLNGNSTLLSKMVDVYHSENAEVVIAFEEVPQEKVSRFGIADPVSSEKENDVFRLAGIVEKPDPSQAPSNLAVAARYIMAPSIFNELKNQCPGKNDEVQLTDAIQNLIKGGAHAFGVRLGEYEKRYDVGNLQSYTEAFVQFALADPSLGDNVRRLLKA